MIENKTAFEKECDVVEAKTDVGYFCIGDIDSRKTEVHEDDGALIVKKCGQMVAFDIGQDRPLREQNERITAVLVALKLEKWLKVEYILHDQEDIDDEEDDTCRHCGGFGCR